MRNAAVALALGVIVGLVPLAGRAPQTIGAARAAAPPIAINDNRTGAGTLTGTTLTIRLEARAGDWRPDGDGGPAVRVKAFAVEGRPLQIPSPLIRVVEGTTIRALVRNGLDGEPIAIHGMYTRPGSPADATGAVVIAPGEVREIAFAAGRPGAYYYWAATDPATTMAQRAGPDTQLSGAIIVDPKGAPKLADRVLLIGNWNNGVPAGEPGRATRFVINGRSWPHTERFNYRVGDVVRMQLINAGAAVHPMHLHGFYFNVDGRGDEREHTSLEPAAPDRLVVTERMASGSTFALTWKPTRPGNWLFHCHDNVHLQPGGPLDGRPAPAADAHHHVENHALEMMAGPVMGITVTGVSSEAAPPSSTRRQLRLVARVDTDGTDAEPAFGYTLDTGPGAVRPAPPYLPGPTIVLKRGEPVSISVVNELPEPTSVHWHGIELESYYDGVAGFSGLGRRITPAIAPGASFDARFTPPRSGTFIYHTHVNEVRQQQAGLSGALLVVDDPATYNPTRDIVMLVTVPRKAADVGVVLLNGSSTPAAKVMRAGQRYRLRFINVHTARPSMRMRLLNGTTLLTWRALAKDGMDLPLERAVEGPSEVQMGNGETYDFEFVAPAAGDLKISVSNAGGVLLASMPIELR